MRFEIVNGRPQHVRESAQESALARKLATDGSSSDTQALTEWGRRRRFRTAGSGLSAASKHNPRNLPCKTCKQPNKLTPSDVRNHLQCDDCADREEGVGYY